MRESRITVNLFSVAWFLADSLSLAPEQKEAAEHFCCVVGVV